MEQLPSELFLKDIENQFQFESYDLRLNTEITSLDELADFDAIYIATGRDGSSFGRSDHPEGAFATDRDGVFGAASCGGAARWKRCRMALQHLTRWSAG